MTDYGHPIAFGLSLIPSVDSLSDRGSGLIAEAQAWVDAESDWAIDLGLDTFIFWPRRASLEQVELFAKEVVPGVRERVSERRAKG